MKISIITLMKTVIYGLIFSLSVFICSCRDEMPVLKTEETQLAPGRPHASIKGLYLLNEGNMGQNKASIDCFDFTTGIYYHNIFPERNPSVVKELGSVGNDIQIYGNRLYAVINYSNLVEVMDATTAKHIGTIEIDNCRYITFKNDKAYISSYAGPVGNDPYYRKGIVAEVDTATLQITRTATVGYQPEEMVIVDNKLFVANSGGYMAPDYDRTISVVDLSSFTEVRKIDVAVNLHRIRTDNYGNMYVTSRGDYKGTPSDIYVLDPYTEQVKGKLNIPADNLCISDDKIYIYSNDWRADTGHGNSSYVLYSITAGKIISDHFINDGTEKNITLPYGIAVNPETKEIFVTDAPSFTDPGKLYCYSSGGYLQWSTTTGDAPAHIVFTRLQLIHPDKRPDTPQTGPSPYITKVLDYRPAPGQNINILPYYEPGDTQEDMNEKVLKAIGNNHQGTISLGAYGGYVIVGFDHTIENKPGEKDFRVLGNAFSSMIDSRGGSSEPGILMVAYDENGNGMPDDGEWYELAGSEYNKPETLKNYTITYDLNSIGNTSSQYIPWKDSEGQNGYIQKIQFHNQPYYPQWIETGKLTFSGTRLAPNAKDIGVNGSSYWVQYFYDWGYADNKPNDSDDSCFDIDWAVDAQGNKVSLPGIDFIKIYTGVNQYCGPMLGESSTEVSGIIDLHLIQ